MRRRDFIALLGGTSVWPLAARAQQRPLPVIGFLSPGSTETDASRRNAARRGFTEIGYVEGQNVAIEYRGTEYQYDRLPALAADLVNRQVAAIVVVSAQRVLAAKAATNTIPIVFAMGADPVELGVVTNLSRPDGNITGVYNVNTAMFTLALPITSGSAQPRTECARPVSESTTRLSSGRPRSAADIPIWKTLALGNRRDVNSLQSALDNAPCRLGVGDEAIGRPTFPFTKTKVELPREAGDCSAGGMSTHTSINYNNFDEPDIPKVDLRSRAESPRSGQTASIHTGILAIFVVIASDERVAVDNDRSPGRAGSPEANRNRSPRRFPPRQQPSERKP
jgi:hypothetical protein